MIDQPWTTKSWENCESKAEFFTVKGIVLNWLRSFGLNEVKVYPIQSDDLPFLHPGAAAYLVAKGQTIGWFGEVHPEVSLAYELEPTESPICFEIDLEAVLDASIKRSKPPSDSYKFPPSTRDLALLVDVELTHDEMAAAISKFPQKRHLKSWHIFDVYQEKRSQLERKVWLGHLAFAR